MEAAKKLAKKDKKDGKRNGAKSINGHPPGGKFPLKPEKGQTNKCTTDGKQYYFHFKTSRWFLVDRESNVALAPAANTANTYTRTSGTSLESDILQTRMAEAITAYASSLSRRD
jgi:hypothetical protein